MCDEWDDYLYNEWDDYLYDEWDDKYQYEDEDEDYWDLYDEWDDWTTRTSNSNLGLGPPVRCEEIQIMMTFDKATVDRLRDVVEVLVKIPEYMEDQDDFGVTYTFTCDYYGDIVRALTAVETIIDDPETIVSEVDCEMLEEGRILIFEVLTKLDSVIRKVRGVTPPATEEKE